MFRYSRLVMAGVVSAFAGWCALSLRADFAQMSFSPLWQCWNLVLLATTLSLLNYGLRIARWRWYLSRLGHRIPVGFSALTYIAGFAFTLSPAKLGELVKARYYTGLGIPLRDVMAAFLAERLMDLLALLALTLLVLREFPHYLGLIFGVGIVIAVGASLLALLPLETIARFFTSSPRIPKFIAQTTAGLLNSLGTTRSLLRPMTISLGLLVAIMAWSSEGLGLGVLGSIFSPARNDATIAVGIYAVAVLVGTLSFLPGGLGGTEAV